MTLGFHIILATGGTGGHIFPAIAVAEELQRRKYTVSLVTDRRTSNLDAGLKNIPVYQINSSGIRGGLPAKIKGAVSISVGILQAVHFLIKVRPKCIIGFGGYASAPTTLAAAMCGLPFIIHEQNAVIGRANRLVSARAAKIATSFVETTGLAPQLANRVINTGNPVRSEFSRIRDIEYPKISSKDKAFRVLVLGGSQGAKIFSDVIPEAFFKMPELLKRRFTIAQQCRADDIARVRQKYRQAGMSPELATFFDDVPTRMGDAHIVITRSGASTVAELTEAGRPAILVPYPYATDNHQNANALSIDKSGAGWLIRDGDFTPEALTSYLQRCIKHPDIAMNAAIAARQLGGRRAAAGVADEVEQLLNAVHIVGSRSSDKSSESNLR